MECTDGVERMDRKIIHQQALIDELVNLLKDLQLSPSAIPKIYWKEISALIAKAEKEATNG